MNYVLLFYFTASAILVLMNRPAKAMYHGDGTCYDVGLGACGKHNRDSELVAAVAVSVYGNSANPNNAPICGKHACVQTRDGRRQVTVKIVD
ncbi:hypothetical protein BV898_10813 [Hypsibius exemplaris]|uniref:RlpA-like protein double-psi beta-barrel domain-containing protein n=1 Tax=Hypsibius exemplaris TaxID=2072580 RepID=A0A1W0WIL5_HYPEX|nr:hypothetical protein BV898_10813 [Hypsibius exemplaris]